MNQVDHIELSTDDPKAAVAFYAKVFGWKAKADPTPGGGPPYHMFRTANGGGGITAKMMPEQPTAWLPYVTVKSVKTSLATAGANGGATVLDFTPIGDMGAIGVLRDPTGGHIGVWEPGKPAKPAPKKVAKKAASKKVAKKAAPKKAAKKPATKAAKKKR